MKYLWDCAAEINSEVEELTPWILSPTSKEFYKVHIKGNGGIHSTYWPKHYGTLDTASIVYFHGNPRPHEVKNLTWMREHWI